MRVAVFLTKPCDRQFFAAELAASPRHEWVDVDARLELEQLGWRRVICWPVL
jgi:hypothetical protein